MTITFDSTITHNLEAGLSREWLETNGIGGWASSTLAGAHTRRYHGLLVAALSEPLRRVVLLSRLDETIVRGNARVELGCNLFPGAIHPKGYLFLKSFTKDLFPTFIYEAGGIVLEKKIAAIAGENTVVVSYRLLAANEPFTLELRPLVAGRDYHTLTKSNHTLNINSAFADSELVLAPYEDLPHIYISVPGATFDYHPEWYHNFEYREERSRGFEYQEDLFTPGAFKLPLSPDHSLDIIISTQPTARRLGMDLLNGEAARREKILATVPAKDEFTRKLVLAGDQFIIDRGKNQKSIIAGYHWFADWGRDTMIALPGLCLSTKRHEEAKSILRTFCAHQKDGLIPNRFPERGDAHEYNAVDAPLWLFVAAHAYLNRTKDAGMAKELSKTLAEIVEAFERGTHYSIKVDSADGLLHAGDPTVQLTWMDARVGDWVVTPRQGKAVEVNALWYNALMILAALHTQLKRTKEAKHLSEQAEQVKTSFLKLFWNEDRGALFDYIDGDLRDDSIRPNQVFALSLPFTLLPPEKAIRVLRIIEERLYTPYGLKTLDSRHPNYRGVYSGNAGARDSAYHQGTVWSWLLGPYITALIRYDEREGRVKAAAAIEKIKPHLLEAGIGTISEIFDAEYPHTPRGCIAQAWSVGAILQALEELTP